MFHDLRRRFDDAIHGYQRDRAEAFAALQLVRRLTVLFHRTLGGPRFKPGPFQPPCLPADAPAKLQARSKRLRAERDNSRTTAEHPCEAAEARAQAAAADRAVSDVLAAEAHAARAVLTAALTVLQEAAATTQPAARHSIVWCSRGRRDAAAALMRRMRNAASRMPAAAASPLSGLKAPGPLAAHTTLDATASELQLGRMLCS